MLSVSGLINYMGKVDLPLNAADAQQSGIAIKPVLLRKGNTRLGLYGVGNIKDQRMHFELRSNRVRMFMPKDKDDWFNILILHQNRWVFGVHYQRNRTLIQVQSSTWAAELSARGHVRRQHRPSRVGPRTRLPNRSRVGGGEEILYHATRLVCCNVSGRRRVNREVCRLAHATT